MPDVRFCIDAASGAVAANCHELALTVTPCDFGSERYVVFPRWWTCVGERGLAGLSPLVPTGVTLGRLGWAQKVANPQLRVNA